jgi:hypothetical protein
MHRLFGEKVKHSILHYNCAIHVSWCRVARWKNTNMAYSYCFLNCNLHWAPRDELTCSEMQGKVEHIKFRQELIFTLYGYSVWRRIL